MNVTLKQFIEGKISSLNVSKKLVYNKLGMSQAGFIKMLENDSISLKKFIELSTILNFDPKEYFSLYGYKIPEIDLNQVNEDFQEYRKIKTDVNKVLNNGGSEVLELIKQNGELIAIIKNLTSK